MSELEARLAWLKRQLDEVAADNLKKDYTVSGLRKELRQKQAAFVLLTELQQRLHGVKEVSEIFEETLPLINANAGMDRTVVLVPMGEGKDLFRPAHWTGFAEEGRADEFAARMRATSLEFDPEFARTGAALLVNKSTDPTPLIEQLRQVFEVPYFVCVPVTVEGEPLGLLLSGRLKEAGTFFPPINNGDVETFRAVAGLISAVVQTMKVTVLEEMDRLKTEFFANISHEFRTPITLTLGPLGSALAGRYGEMPEMLRTQLDVMRRNQERLMSLVNQILDLAKLDAGKMQLKAAPLRNFNAYVELRALQFRPAAEARGLGLQLDLDPELDGADFYVDREKLEKVLFNLLSNALKFTKAGDITITTRREGPRLRLTVADTGIGIKASELPHVFDRFRQADGSSSREYAGTGIGLALVQDIVKLHGGEITVESEYGRGTTFHLSLPLGKGHLPVDSVVELVEDEMGASVPATDLVDVATPESDRTAVASDNADMEAGRDPSKPTVLYVDDNRELRAFVRDLLAPQYNVFLAIDGGDGLDQARRCSPDLVLSDLMMPRVSGIELCKSLRQDPHLQDLPFVLLTAKSTLQSKVEGLEEGADDYLSKPFSEAELMARLRNLIKLRKEQTRLRRELQAARAIQQAMLPPLKQTVGRLEFDALYHPSEALSGDSFDVIEHKGWIYVYMADVTSHGTAAAQVTYLLHEIFRRAVEQRAPVPLPELMVEVAASYKAHGLEYDVSLAAARFNPESRALEYALGGAPPPVSFNGARSVLVARPGPLLSARVDSQSWREYSVKVRVLSPGERIYFYTDGCYEFLTEGRLFGRRRFYDVLAGAEGDWKQAVLDKLSDVNGGPSFEDDLSILQLKLLGPAGEN